MTNNSHADRRWRNVKVFAALTILASGVSLAIVIGNRLSQEALAVLAGAVCGVAAAIPTSLLVVAVSRWRNDSKQNQPTYQQPATGLTLPFLPLPYQPTPTHPPSPPTVLNHAQPRTFTIIGPPGDEQAP
jgi:hypothetical protein